MAETATVKNTLKRKQMIAGCIIQGVYKRFPVEKFELPANEMSDRNNVVTFWETYCCILILYLLQVGSISRIAKTLLLLPKLIKIVGAEMPMAMAYWSMSGVIILRIGYVLSNFRMPSNALASK